MRSIGLDIVEVARITADLEKYGQRFIDRILGEREKALLAERQDREQFLAGRFAAKEAVVKALHPFLKDRPAWPVIEILRNDDGAPELVLPLEIESCLDGAKCMLSLSHEKHYAVAVAIFVSD